MNCKKCGIEIAEDKKLCQVCAAEAEQGKARSKSFWGELEKNQTTIEEFGYKVKTEIRKSENTVVYIASNEAEETVAIKKITLPYGQSGAVITEGELSDRIRAEMDTLSKISSGSGNRFVITYYDYKLVGNADKLKYDLYIRMDYLTSIGQLYSESKLSVRSLLKMGADICDALDWCHKNGRTHNNLNLNNIFIGKDERYVLGDFASFANKQNEVEYCMAPELFYGDKPSVGTDIYSLGMVMFVLLNKGVPPFAETNSPEEIKLAVERLRSGEMPTLVRPVNHRLSDLIYKAISSKGKRFNSVEEMKKAIEFLLSSMPEEWLEQNVNDIAVEHEGGEARPEEIEVVHAEPVVEKRLKKERTSKKAEKVGSKELEPEELALKKKNVRDFWLIGVVAVALIAAVAAGTIFLYNSGNRAIYSLIDSESYAVAFKEISELHEKGQNVDDLLKRYVGACMSDTEYKRVVQALPLFSDEAYEDSDYFISLYSDILNSGKEKQAAAAYNYLHEKESLRLGLEGLLAQ